MNIGLKELTEEDIEKISEEISLIIRKNLMKRVPSNKVDNYDIVIDVDISDQELKIDIDINSQLFRSNQEIEQQIIDKTLEETFNELDKFLKEKYSCDQQEKTN